MSSLIITDGTGFDDGAIDTNALAESAVTGSKIDWTTVPQGKVSVGSGQTISTSGTTYLSGFTSSGSMVGVTGVSAGIQINIAGRYAVTAFLRSNAVNASNTWRSIRLALNGSTSGIDQNGMQVYPNSATFWHLLAFDYLDLTSNDVVGLSAQCAGANTTVDSAFITCMLIG